MGAIFGAAPLVCSREGFVQPADQFRHVQRQRYAQHVPGDLCTETIPTARPTPALRLFSCAPAVFRFGTQGATKFNQPLSFDTSEVTNMGSMFNGGSGGHVRYARALWHTATPRETVSHTPPWAFISFLYSGRARPSTTAVELFDTSKVTDMRYTCST